MQSARKRKLTGTVVELRQHPLSGLAQLILELEDKSRVEIPCESRMTSEALYGCSNGEPPNGMLIWYETGSGGLLTCVGPEGPQERRTAHRFTSPRPMKLIVFASTLPKARAWLKKHAVKDKRLRGLKYVGEGQADTPRDWYAVVVRGVVKASHA